MSNDNRVQQFLKGELSQRYLNFMITITTVSMNVTTFASIIGQFHSITPSMNQNATPTANVMCIQSETPFVSRV